MQKFTDHQIIDTKAAAFPRYWLPLATCGGGGDKQQHAIQK